MRSINPPWLSGHEEAVGAGNGWLAEPPPAEHGHCKAARAQQHRLVLAPRSYGWHSFQGDADVVGRTSGAAEASAHEVDCLLVTTFGFSCSHLLAEFITIGFMEQRSLMLCS